MFIHYCLKVWKYLDSISSQEYQNIWRTVAIMIWNCFEISHILKHLKFLSTSVWNLIRFRTLVRGCDQNIWMNLSSPSTIWNYFKELLSRRMPSWVLYGSLNYFLTNICIESLNFKYSVWFWNIWYSKNIFNLNHLINSHLQIFLPMKWIGMNHLWLPKFRKWIKYSDCNLDPELRFRSILDTIPKAQT